MLPNVLDEFAIVAPVPLKHLVQLPISALQTVKGGWSKNALPHGPDLVQLPDALRAEFGL
ncbi:hypothetical protein DLJ53_33535 [Acuticoccus sediminis]|uniref:Uncharacterized protein n=1 Tax=Acuticoccus sediminis TaxID=2184697 RepID=A0A8B2NNK0_9HYPH|nr:hypothetical protein [Acuticoccus sediminis]RAH96073.1 hypothetical protein DLJ53_33535 [Acuticoccus sediminis]